MIERVAWIIFLIHMNVEDHPPHPTLPTPTPTPHHPHRYRVLFKLLLIDTCSFKLTHVLVTQIIELLN